MKVLLIGPMGAGKSTLGKILSENLSWPYIDNDGELVANYGYTKKEIEELDIKTLHELEAQYLRDIHNRPGPFIAGVAASVIDNEENRVLISHFFAVYLRLPLEKIIERAGSSGIGRQAVTMSGNEILIERFNRRDPLYKKSAQIIIELGENPQDDAATILKAISN